MKLKWKVNEKPSGTYSSFQKRMWPDAYFNNEIMVSITCADGYEPRNVKIGNHAPVKINVTDRRKQYFVWRTLKGEFSTLKEAKEVAQKFFDKNPEFFGINA